MSLRKSILKKGPKIYFKYEILLVQLEEISSFARGGKSQQQILTANLNSRLAERYFHPPRTNRTGEKNVKKRKTEKERESGC